MKLKFHTNPYINRNKITINANYNILLKAIFLEEFDLKIGDIVNFAVDEEEIPIKNFYMFKSEGPGYKIFENNSTGRICAKVFLLEYNILIPCSCAYENFAFNNMEGIKLTILENSNLEKIIKDIVSSYYKIPLQKIFFNTREREITKARHVIQYFLAINKDKLGYTLNQIGLLSGGKDHATVYNAHRKISNLIYQPIHPDNIKLAEDIKQIEERITNAEEEFRI